MTPTENDEDRDPVEALAEEFVARRRRGEEPTIEEYVALCPDRADDIRALFPTIAAVERHKPRPESSGRFRLRGPALLGGERLGEYLLVREIGRGGMGVVYEAMQESLGRRVAVKVLPGVVGPDDRAAQRFRREARTAAKLHHANIIPVYAVGEQDGHLYYVMQLIAGVGLDRVLRVLSAGEDATTEEDAEGRWQGTSAEDPRSVVKALRAGAFSRSSNPLSSGPTVSSASSVSTRKMSVGSVAADPAEGASALDFGPCYWKGVARIGWQAADALEFAHVSGVLHRDVKPSNLLLDAAGAVWVADFGLAKAADHDELSRAGDLVGTLRYMAPERFRGECDARSDVYALGLTLYEALTLCPAFEAADHAELVRRIASIEPTRPRAINPTVPLDLETIILKAIAPDPRSRYASAGAMADDLARFLDGRPVLARPSSTLEVLSRWVARNRLVAVLSGAILALTLVSILFIGLFLKAPPRRHNPPPPNRSEGPDFGPPSEDEGPPPRRRPGDFRRPPPRPFRDDRRPPPPPPPLRDEGPPV